MKYVVGVAWLGVAVLPQGIAANGASPLATWLVWSVWLLVAIALWIPHPLSLATVRFLAPLATVHAGWLVASDDDIQQRIGSVAGFLVMLAASCLMFAASFGAHHAQAAAYGHERRHLLRPPIAVLLPLLLLWLLVAVGAGLAAFSKSLRVSLPTLLLLVPLVVFAIQRATILTRRWLVFVPAGIAVHDPLMLRDTFMVRSHEVRAIRVASTASTAFDATGTTWGVIVELELDKAHDMSLSQFGARVAGTLDRLHVSAILVAPSRPSVALANDSASQHRDV